MKVTGRILGGWLPAVVILVVGPWLVAAQQTDDEARTSPSAITTADQAVELALKYTGFDRLKSVQKHGPGADDVTVVSISDSTTPFIADQIDGRRAWQISFRNVVLELERTAEAQELDHPMDFQILIDSATGQLLRIGSVGKPKDRVCTRPPTSAEATEQIASLGEAYHGLPDKPPNVDFLVTLNKCKFYPLLAERIRGLYVLHSHRRSADPSPAWIIYMQGLPPLSPSDSLPGYKSSNRRTVVDADSGWVIYSTNIPYPELGEEEAQRDEVEE